MTVTNFGNCIQHNKKITKVFIDKKENAVITTDNQIVNIYDINSGECFYTIPNKDLNS